MNISLNIFSLDAANFLSRNMNASCGNVQFTEVKIESDELFSNMIDNNSSNDTESIPESKK